MSTPADAATFTQNFTSAADQARTSNRLRDLYMQQQMQQAAAQEGRTQTQFDQQQALIPQQQEQMRQQLQQQSVARVADLASKALQLDPSQRKPFLQEAFPMYQKDFQALGKGPNDLANLLQQPDQELQNDLTETAAFGQQQAPISVAPGASLVSPRTYQPLYSAPVKPPAEDRALVDIVDPKSPGGYRTIQRSQMQPGMQQWHAPTLANPGTSGGLSTDNPDVVAYGQNIKAGNATLQNVPSSERGAVSRWLQQQPTATYSPTASSKFTMAANRIESNYLKLPQYQLTANGVPYLQRIDAAIKTPGSVSDQDLLDSLTKLNTGGNAVTEAQINTILKGRSFADTMSVFANKLKNGGVLSDNQRQQVQQIANAIYANYKKGYQPVYNQVTSQLKAAGIPEAFWSIPDLNNLNAQAVQPSVPPSGSPSGIPAGWTVQAH